MIGIAFLVFLLRMLHQESSISIQQRSRRICLSTYTESHFRFVQRPNHLDLYKSLPVKPLLPCVMRTEINYIMVERDCRNELSDSSIILLDHALIYFYTVKSRSLPVNKLNCKF